MYYRSNNLLIFFSTNCYTELCDMLYHDFKRWETSIYTTLWGFRILTSAWRTAFQGDSITGECISATLFKLTIDHYRVSTVRSPLFFRHRNPGTKFQVSVLLKSLTQTVRHRIQKEYSKGGSRLIQLNLVTLGFWRLTFVELPLWKPAIQLCFRC